MTPVASESDHAAPPATPTRSSWRPGRRSVGPALAAVLLLTACGDSNESGDTVGDTTATSDSAVVPSPAELDVRYSNADAGIDAHYTITCGATASLAGDDVDVDADAACDALDHAAVTQRLIDPADDRVCTEMYGGSDVAEIVGTIDGARVETTVDRTNGCGISDWDDVLGVLLPRPVGVTDPSSPTTSTATVPTTSTTTPASTSTTSPTAPPTTTLPAPERLAAWPTPAGPASLDAVPFLLPGEPIDDVVSGIREQTERAPSGSAAVFGDYFQFWLTDDGSSQVTIRTHLDGRPVGSEEFRVPVEVASWESAFTFRDTGSYNGITLVGDDGFVAVQSYGLDEDTVIDLARSMTRRSDGEPGWEIDAPDLVAVHEGWTMPAIGTASREIDWHDGDRQLRAELSISVGQPSRFGQVWQPNSDVAFADVDGSQAMVVQYDHGDTTPTIVVWSPAHDQVIQFGVLADTERALEIARGIGPVPEDVWTSVAQPPAAPPDGCNSFVC